MVFLRHPSTSYKRRISAATCAEITAKPPPQWPQPPHAQEVVAHQRLARRAAQRAAQLDGRFRRRHRLSPPRFAPRDGRRALFARATVMRHFLATLTILALTACMVATTARRLLVAIACSPKTLPARPPAAAPRAIPLAPITPRAHIHHRTAAVADKTAAIRSALHNPGLEKAWTSSLPKRDTRCPGATPQASRWGRLGANSDALAGLHILPPTA